MSINDENAKAYVLSATVASELHAMTDVARQVSIIAKNARALAIRAGESVAGFRAITGFIEEISQFSSQRGEAIDQMATDVSRISVENIRMSDALSRFNQAYNSDAKYKTSLRFRMEFLNDASEELLRGFRRSIRRLRTEIDEIGGQLRGIQLMVTSSRVEASGAGNFKEGLDSVADQLAKAYEIMNGHISKARSMMHNIRMEQL